MRRALGCSVIFLAFLAPVIASEISSAQRLITLDDLLTLESFGDASFAPDGSRLLFVRNRSAEDRPLRGFDDPALTSERLFIVDGANGAPQEILPLPGEVYSSLHGMPWAADSSGMLLMETSSQAYRMAWWNAQDGKVITLPGRPPLSYFPFAWLGPRVVYPVIAGNAQQPLAQFQVLEAINRQWKEAWTGRETAVTVSSSNPLFDSSRPAQFLMLANSRTGAGRKIAEGRYGALAASPNGSMLAAVRFAEQVPEPMLHFEGRGELQIFSVTGEAVRLRSVMADLDIQSLNNIDNSASAIVWSPDSRKLLVGGKPAGAPRSQAVLYEIDAHTGRRLKLAVAGMFVDPVSQTGGAMLPFGWLGTASVAVAAHYTDVKQFAPSRLGRDYGETRQLRFDVFALSAAKAENLTRFARRSVDRFIIRNSQHALLVIADDALWQVSPGKPEVKLSPDETGAIKDFATGQLGYDPAMDGAFSHTARVERIALLAISERAQALQRIVLDLPSAKTIQSDPSAGFIANSPDLLAGIVISRERWREKLVRTGRGARVLAVANEALNAKAMGEISSFTYRYGSRQLIGWLSMPPGISNSPRPAVVFPYGGTIYGAQAPAGAQAGMPQFSGQLLAAQGYVVIYPSLPLESGESSDVMGTLADEIIAAVDELAARKIVDPNRVGVWGQSFGGFCAAAALARRSDRFKAGVSMAGIYDWIHVYGLQSLDRSFSDVSVFASTAGVEGGQIRLGKPFWENTDAYLLNSPIFHVDKLTSPLLMLHGDLDTWTTSLSGAERMYNALVRAGQKPALVHYWGEGHVAESPAAIRDQWRRVVAWFETYLKN